jgi:tetratricopeptide (TPR) repeat protein
VRGRAWCGLLVGLVVVAIGGTARAARHERDPALEREYQAELPDPKLADQFAAATRSMDGGQMAEAAAAFRKLAEVAPKHAPTLWRLSAMELAAGHRDEAIKQARAAVAATDRWQARSTLAEALLVDGTGTDLSEAQGLLDELHRLHPGMDTSLLSAELAAHRNDLQGLKTAVREMDGQPSQGPGPDYFRFVVAASEERTAFPRTRPRRCGRSPASRRTCGRCAGRRSAASRWPSGWAGCR